jgi:tetratricopeptide (TPR) repeat protein
MAKRSPGRLDRLKSFWLSLREMVLQHLESRDRLVRQDFQAGVRAVQQARWSDAVAAFSRVLSLRRDHFLAHLYLGVALYHQGRQREAQATFRRAKRLNPKRFSAYEAANALPLEVGPARGTSLGESGRDISVLGLEDGAETVGEVTKRRQRVIRRLHSPEPRRSLRGGSRRRVKGRRPRPTDFISPEEARKFQNLPPITKDEIARIDWDELITRILE